MWSRIHLIPLLQAEEDRDQVRRHFADQAREKELLGTETSPYYSDRYANPLYGISFGSEPGEWLSDTNNVCQIRPPELHIYPQQCHSIVNSKSLKDKDANPQEYALQGSLSCRPRCTQL
jgi:hypothetical protein